MEDAQSRRQSRDKSCPYIGQMGDGHGAFRTAVSGRPARKHLSHHLTHGVTVPGWLVVEETRNAGKQLVIMAPCEAESSRNSHHVMFSDLSECCVPICDKICNDAKTSDSLVHVAPLFSPPQPIHLASHSTTPKPPLTSLTFRPLAHSSTAPNHQQK